MKIVAYASFFPLFFPLLILSAGLVILARLLRRPNSDRWFGPITNYSNWVMKIID